MSDLINSVVGNLFRGGGSLGSFGSSNISQVTPALGSVKPPSSPMVPGASPSSSSPQNNAFLANALSLVKAGGVTNPQQQKM